MQRVEKEELRNNNRNKQPVSQYLEEIAPKTDSLNTRISLACIINHKIYLRRIYLP